MNIFNLFKKKKSKNQEDVETYIDFLKSKEEWLTSEWKEAIKHLKYVE